jgi:predicted DNA-binding transcriptional regulator YafY
MLASRLISLLMLLQARERMSARELATELEVGVRTIHRDIDQLSAAGIPVYAERGRNGGFRLRDGYQTRLTGLTQSEAEILLMAGLPGPVEQLGLAQTLTAARLKLIAALPGSVRPSADRIAARFHLDAAAWFQADDPMPALQTIARAVWTERLLQMRYRRAGETVAQPRTLSPLGLVLKGGIWYLVARNGNALRTYRVANIHDARVLDGGFVRPRNFDLPSHWTRASREYEEGVYREYADVLLSPEGQKRLELLGPHVTRAAAKTAHKPDRNGWVRCTIPLESIEFGVRELLRLGEEVRVMGPAKLRSQLAALASRIAAAHSRPSARAKR